MVPSLGLPHVRHRLRSIQLDTLLVLLLAGVALADGVLFALINPPFLSPDEAGHYDHVASLFLSPGAEIAGAESHQPPLYYWAVLAGFALGWSGPSEMEVYGLATDYQSMGALMGVRLLSALLSVLVVPLVYLTAKCICPRDRFVCLGAAAFAALLPMLRSLGASVNNDTLATVFSAGLCYLGVRAIAEGFSIPRSILLVLVAVAALETKTSTIAIVGAIALLLAWQLAGKAKPRLESLNRAVLVAAGFGLGAVILAVGWAVLSNRRMMRLITQNSAC